MYLRNNEELLRLSQLNIEEHYQSIVKYLADHDAPLDYLISGELAQLQTFAIPSISSLLQRTKQYQNNGIKRLDDTRAILTECLSDSVESPRGEHMVKHLNWIHSHYNISNDDYLYTLALFMIEPVRWMESFGYRPLTEREKRAGYLAFKSLGHAMNIDNIPESRDEFVAWYLNYRKQNMEFHTDNKLVTDGYIAAIKEMFPRLLRPIVRPMILTLINDSELLAATGQKAPWSLVQKSIRVFMAVRRRVQCYINPWQNKSFESSYLGQYYKSYPNGYQSCPLGPEKMIKKTAASCPFEIPN